jgi:hypothetical protein
LLQRSVALEVDLAWVSSLERRNEMPAQPIATGASVRVTG